MDGLQDTKMPLVVVKGYRERKVQKASGRVNGDVGWGGGGD